ncbi:OLC1v1003363C1 [Oldenlandia corymbosa var. corymbosa]|uniref:OLC1v1003363C1 n=1 Tax=Oldenlandia corymbosa var. corymbosa TaxID=529605 RepID=A0AAV1DBR2_OLDCO|nr:OLC1v1003363C1 [Oldenlandia corymbosa var. corymbosa]
MDREDNSNSPRKPPVVVAATAGGGGGNGSGGGGGNSDRLKRDEWSEGAVSSLLEAYEEKWILRNRAKLKGQDWEDVAKHVSARANSTKLPKTQTQCKNKIESMKKRYRSESAAADGSSWPLYSRLDLLLRGNSHPPPTPSHPPPPPPPPAPLPPPVASHPSLVFHDPPQQHPSAAPAGLAMAQQGTINPQVSHDSNGCERVVKEDGAGVPNFSNPESGKDAVETDSSTPAIYSDKEKLKSKHTKIRIEKKKHRRESCAIADSIRLLAEVVVRSEQARMDTMRELERMRAETEARRGEMDLKRTEIIANTQLEIAKLFAGIAKGGAVDPSLKIGRN